MSRMRLIFAIFLIGLLIPAIGQARGVPVPRLSSVFEAVATDYTIPASWAGIWEDRDSVFVGCEPSLLLETSTDTDTLCAGETFGPVGDETTFICEGTIGETSFNITCTTTFAVEACTVTSTYHMVGTRTGDTYVAVSTVLSAYSPPGSCFNQPDQCSRIVTRSTRLGPAPPGCATPVEPVTWGNLKALYR